MTGCYSGGSLLGIELQMYIRFEKVIFQEAINNLSDYASRNASIFHI